MRSSNRVGWLSLISQPKSCLLAPFTSSYKNFKGSFFKFVVKKESRQFSNDGDAPRFPFYWTHNLTCFLVWPRSSLTREDMETLSVLDKLHWKISTRWLLQVFFSSTRFRDVKGIFLCISWFCVCFFMIFWLVPFVAIMSSVTPEKRVSCYLRSC